ncbi:hypothetical protein [Zhenpiania hominis]|uniref:hypothetical protein n=1 Tax=Zhenpiania hominis TaxID=2763644 RepID=UPI0039F627A6
MERRDPICLVRIGSDLLHVRKQSWQICAKNLLFDHDTPGKTVPIGMGQDRGKLRNCGAAARQPFSCFL